VEAFSKDYRTSVHRELTSQGGPTHCL